MIITLIGANFADSNIGTSNQWRIVKSLKGVTCSNSATTVNKGSTYSATFTVTSGYTFSSATVTVGGVDKTSSLVWNNEKTSATLSLATTETSGNIYITITALSNSGSGEEGSGSGGNNDNTNSYLYDIATLNDNMQTSGTSASLTSNSSYFTFTDIPVTAGGTYRIAYARRVWEFDSSGTAIKNFSAKTDVENYTFTVSDNTATISVCISKSDVTDPYTVILEVIDKEEGGDDGGDQGGNTVIDTRKLSETGATLAENTAMSTTSSTPTTNNTYYTYQFIPVTGGTTYRIKYGRRIWELDSSKSNIKTFAAHTDCTDYTFTVEDNTAYISVTIKTSELAPANATIETIG